MLWYCIHPIYSSWGLNLTFGRSTRLWHRESEWVSYSVSSRERPGPSWPNWTFCTTKTSSRRRQKESELQGSRPGRRPKNVTLYSLLRVPGGGGTSGGRGLLVESCVFRSGRVEGERGDWFVRGTKSNSTTGGVHQFPSSHDSTGSGREFPVC